MRVRQPQFDFSTTPVHWTKNPEFAQSMNAHSSYIPHLERFLNRVLLIARSKLTDNDEATLALRAEISTFIKQEGNHTAMHCAFNDAVQRSDIYPKAKEFDDKIAEEFSEMLRTKSFKFLLAYCEGFETQGPPSALVWLDEIEDLLEGADPVATNLWKWHIMEEYEHRMTCHNIYHRFYGGYFMRIYAFFYMSRHLGGFAKRYRQYALQIDRQNMSPAELKASIRRERSADLRIAWLTVPRLLRAISPFYHPRDCPKPKMFDKYMAGLEQQIC